MAQQTVVSVKREELGNCYVDLILQNPLLDRIAAKTAAMGWSTVETRTMQLLTACASNASLQSRLASLERSLASSKA